MSCHFPSYHFLFLGGYLQGVSVVVTDCLCGFFFWCRRLTNCLLHVDPPSETTGLNDSRMWFICIHLKKPTIYYCLFSLSNFHTSYCTWQMICTSILFIELCSALTSYEKIRTKQYFWWVHMYMCRLVNIKRRSVDHMEDNITSIHIDSWILWLLFTTWTWLSHWYLNTDTGTYGLTYGTLCTLCRS